MALHTRAVLTSFVDHRKEKHSSILVIVVPDGQGRVRRSGTARFSITLIERNRFVMKGEKY